MFEQMIERLQRGQLPDAAAIRPRLSAGLIKKLGIIQTPCSFWTGDPKINPRSEHLLWAAILLADREKYAEIGAIIALEARERWQARQGRADAAPRPPAMEELLAAAVAGLLDLAPDPAFRKILENRVERLLPPAAPAVSPGPG